MIITISGLSGAGKGTICRILSQKLGYKYYSIGDLRRKMAQDKGMTIEEFNKLGEKESFTDVDADNYQKKLALKEDNFIMEGRLSYHFMPKSLKIFLYVRPEVAAKRIFNDKSDLRINQKKTKDVDEQLKLTVERDNSDVTRYKKYYGIDDYTSKKHYDLYIDTSDLTVEEVIKRIMDGIGRHS